MKRAIGVVRVSQVNGREGDSFASPSQQLDRIKAACGDDLQLVDHVEELDTSGGKPLEQRPKLLRAVEAVEKGKADVIVVAYFDRLVRSVAVQTEVVRRIEEAGGDVLALDTGMITNGGAAQEMTTTFLGAVAQYHRKATAERSREAQIMAIARGVPPWDRVTPGYRKREDRRYEPDPDLAPVVREAFRMRADGTTIAEVRRWLAENGIKRSYYAVQCLLKSRVVLGEIHFGSYEPNLAAHEPIVDRALWQRVQNMRTPSGPQQKSDRLLARLGILRCSCCGSRMVVGAQTQNGRTYSFYRCGSNVQDCKQRVTISAEVAERVIVGEVRQALDGFAGVRSVREHIRHARLRADKTQADLDAALRVMTASGTEDEDVAIERLAVLRDVRDQARERLDELDVPGESEVLLLNQDWDQLSLRDQRRAIKACIARATVMPAWPGQKTSAQRISVVHYPFDAVFTGKAPMPPMHLS